MKSLSLSVLSMQWFYDVRPAAQRVLAALDARRGFAQAGFVQLNDFYLVSVLRGLIPAGLRLTHLAAAHPDYDLRDGLRYHQSLLKAIEDNNSELIRQLVHAFNGRERKLALCHVMDHGARRN